MCLRTQRSRLLTSRHAVSGLCDRTMATAASHLRDKGDGGKPRRLWRAPVSKGGSPYQACHRFSRSLPSNSPTHILYLMLMTATTDGSSFVGGSWVFLWLAYSFQSLHVFGFQVLYALMIRRYDRRLSGMLPFHYDLSGRRSRVGRLLVDGIVLYLAQLGQAAGPGVL